MDSLWREMLIPIHEPELHLIGYKNMQNMYIIPDEVYLCYK